MLLIVPWSPAGTASMQALLPAAQAWIGWLEPALQVHSLRLVETQGRSRVHMQVSLAKPVRVGEREVRPHARGRAWVSVPAGQAWQAPVLLAIVLVLWPSRRPLERAWRVLPGLAAALVLLAFDTPLVMLAEVRELLRQAHGVRDFDTLVAWADFLGHGGRVLLALGAAALVLRATRPSGHHP